MNKELVYAKLDKKIPLQPILNAYYILITIGTIEGGDV